MSTFPPINMETFRGYKTYIIAILIGVLATGHALGYVDDTSFQTFTALLASGGLMALRAGVAKI